jgi:hypothetical protein
LDDESMRLARLTVDMFRFPPMEPLQVWSRVARDGRRIRVLDISVSPEGEHQLEIARATALLLRADRRRSAAVGAWSPDEWAVPRPDDLVVPDPGLQVANDATDAEEPGPMSGWEIRVMSPGGFASAERKQIWTRDTWSLVQGEPLSPLVRAALAADLPNPLANSGPAGLPFINADLTLSIKRLPRSDWIGLEVSDHLDEEGIAIGSCRLYDLDGAIGWSSVCAVANEAALLT